MIEAVICDFGGVLTSPLAESFAAFRELTQIPPEALGSAMGAIAERDGAHPLFELETGRLSERAFLDAVEQELCRQLGRTLEMASFSDVYWRELKPNVELIGYLRALHEERGYRMALLTNNVREWEHRWRAMVPVDELFELVVDSSAVGLRKPDPAIYELTLARLGLSGEQCVFIDDFANNCEAAAALGIAAVHFLDTEQAIVDVESQLSEPSRSQT